MGLCFCSSQLSKEPLLSNLSHPLVRVSVCSCLSLFKTTVFSHMSNELKSLDCKLSIASKWTVSGAIWRRGRLGWREIKNVQLGYMANKGSNNTILVMRYLNICYRSHRNLNNYYRTVTLNSGGYKYFSILQGRGLSFKWKCIFMIKNINKSNN